MHVNPYIEGCKPLSALALYWSSLPFCPAPSACDPASRASTCMKYDIHACVCSQKGATLAVH